MPATAMMRTLRFHDYGEPADVLRLEHGPIPAPSAGTVCIRVEACSLNPADWALCRGLFKRELPRGIGLDVSGTITAIGAGVANVALGDLVFGRADYANVPTAGASDYAILDAWASLPPGLTHVAAASLPMVVETAARYMGLLDLKPAETIVINGAGTMVGFAAVQMALLKGLKVVAIAGPALAEPLSAFGATVTPRGAGMVERIADLLPAAPDHVLDVAPINLGSEGGITSVLPDLITVAGGDPRRVLTVTDFAGAAATGARTGMEDIAPGTPIELRWDALPEYGQRAADGDFVVPVAQTFALDAWRTALDISLSGRANGKLVLTIGSDGR